MEKEYIKPSEYMKRMGISRNTVYRLVRNNQLDFYKTDTNQIFIKNPFKEETNQANNQPLKVVTYARVSSSQNKTNLETQSERLRLYANAKGYQVFKEFKEVGSGLNDNRKKLNEILNDKTIDILIIEHKDRLTRFGFNYLNKLFELTNRKIEVINLQETENEVMEDFVSIVTSFCARLYGYRRSKRKIEQLIKELKV